MRASLRVWLLRLWVRLLRLRWFTATHEWIAAGGTKAAYIAPGSPWENGYIESFNARLRDELLDGEILYSLKEAQIVIESWRRHYNAVRPHESLGYRPPAPEVFVPALAAWPSTRLGSAPTATLPSSSTCCPTCSSHVGCLATSGLTTVPSLSPRPCGPRPQHRNHVWSYDFVEDRTHDGRKYRMRNVLDDFTHENLAIRVARKLKAIDVIDVLSDLFILADNGPEFVAKAVREWIAAVGARTAYIAPGSPWENGYFESFNARLRDELLRHYGARAPDVVMLLIRRGSLTAASILAMPASSRRCPISDSPATRFRAILFAIGEDDGAALPVVGPGSDPIAQGDLPSR